MSQPAPDAIESLARQVAEPSGLEVRGVHLLSHRLPLTVQVFVQRADGSDVSLDQCAALSGPLGEALEAAALLPGAYVLEISSPGIAEQLSSDRDFTSFHMRVDFFTSAYGTSRRSPPDSTVAESAPATAMTPSKDVRPSTGTRMTKDASRPTLRA